MSDLSTSTGAITVIVPAYNRKDVVVETLESVREQMYRQLQLIVVDDGSTDGTPDVVNAWISKSGMSNAVLLPLERNGGKCSAVNRAIAEVHGEFLMILDSDDVLLPDCFSREVEFLLSHEECGMVYGRAFVLRDGRRTGETVGVFEGAGQIDDVVAYHGDLLFNGNVVISSSVLMRTSLVRKVGGLKVDLHHAHDWDYWIRMSDLAKIGFIEGPLLYYRVGSSGALSANRLRLLKETFGLLSSRKASVDITTYRRALARELKEGLRLSFYGGDPWQCLGISWYALTRMLPDYLRTSSA